jgi:hypothetical protein
MIDPSTLLQDAIDGRVGAQRGYQLYDSVSIAATQKANRHILHRIVKRSRYYSVAKELPINWDRRLQIPNRNPNMVKGKLMHKVDFFFSNPLEP